jgi:trehalose 2-sulfotransferase
VARRTDVELDERDRWVLDPPRGHELHQFLVIAATPRTGSWLLCDALADTGLAGTPREYFGASTLGASRRNLGVPRSTLTGYVREAAGMARGRRPSRIAWPSRRSALRYARAVAERTSTPNGVMSTKVFKGQFDRFWTRSGLEPDDLGAPVRWVRLERRDRAAQAVSRYIASRTGLWTAHHTVRGEVEYDLGDLREVFVSLERGSQGWDDWFAARHIEPLPLFYEDVVEDLGGAVDAVLALLGETRTTEIVPRHGRLADERSARWIGRFLDEAPDLAARRWWSGSG